MNTDTKPERNLKSEVRDFGVRHSAFFRISSFVIRIFICVQMWFISYSVRQGLVQFALIEETFFGLERPGVDDANLFSVRAIDAEDADAARRHAEVKEPSLDIKPGRT